MERVLHLCRRRIPPILTEGTVARLSLWNVGIAAKRLNWLMKA